LAQIARYGLPGKRNRGRKPAARDGLDGRTQQKRVFFWRTLMAGGDNLPRCPPLGRQASGLFACDPPGGGGGPPRGPNSGRGGGGGPPNLARRPPWFCARETIRTAWFWSRQPINLLSPPPGPWPLKSFALPWRLGLCSTRGSALLSHRVLGAPFDAPCPSAGEAPPPRPKRRPPESKKIANEAASPAPPPRPETAP